MTHQTPHPPDEPRDARLRAALRHAPDAEVRPPQALSEAILRQARASAAAAPAPGKAAAPRRSAWALLAGVWEALSRPSLASGLASVMLASLVGVMWWNRLPDEAGELPRLEKRAPPPAAATTPAAEPASAPAPVQVIPKATGQGRPDGAGGAVRDERAPGAARESAQAQMRRIEETAEGKATAAAQAEKSEPGPARAEVPPSAESPHAPPPAPAPVPAMAPAAAPDTARLQERAPSASPLKKANPPGTEERRSLGGLAAARPAEPATENEASNTLGKAASADMASRLHRPAQPPPSAPPLPTLRRSLSQEAGLWSWRRDGGPAQPVTPALLRWLAALDNHAAAPRWTAAPADQAAAGDATRLAFQRDGRILHELALQADGLHWRQAEPAAAWKAPLDARALLALQSALPPAAP